MEHISNVIKSFKSKVKPISTGFRFLDKAIGGYYPGTLTTICGAEDCGKSAFVVSQINHVAVDLHIPTLLVLNNMSQRTFLSCMAAYYCGIETNNVYAVWDAKKHKSAVKSYIKLLKEAPLYIIGNKWWEENFMDKLEELIGANDIKMVFVDEVTSLGCEGKGIVLSPWKSLAVKLDVSVVATTCIWEEREGLDGITPALCDLLSQSDCHGSDVAIGLINYEQFNVRLDERGRDLCDMIGFEILKQKGRNKDRKFLLPWGYLLLRDFSEKQKLTLDEIRQSSGYKIDSLIDKFDLTTEADESMPF